MVCTSDVLTGGGTCAATCSHPAITAPTSGDGCCPGGATIGTDTDCPIVCGDAIVSSGESCDTGIAAGTGSCPSTCTDGIACTSDVLVGTACTAMCTHPAITTPTNGDGCCPTGATIGNDSDCAARCGDGVITAPETCDDGGTASGDGCSATCTVEAAAPTAYRFTDLDVRDPHIFASIFGCNDVTNSVFGIDGVNPLLQDNIQADGDADGLLDLSITHVFTPLLQTAGTSTPSYLAFPDCTAPMSSTSCTLPAGASRLMGAAMNMGGTSVCLAALPGTTRAGYTPATVYPTAGGGGTCYVASAGTVTFDLGGIPITLTDAYIGGEWFGSPATEIRDGLIRGFLSETAANRTYIPADTTGQSAIDCQPLGSLLPGGNPPALVATDPGPPPPCTRPTNPPASCSGNDDRDTGPGGERGWYFYLNFRAARISSYTAL
jgi:cysteine-rich repeat protein